MSDVLQYERQTKKEILKEGQFYIFTTGGVRVGRNKLEWIRSPIVQKLSEKIQ